MATGFYRTRDLMWSQSTYNINPKAQLCFQGTVLSHFDNCNNLFLLIMRLNNWIFSQDSLKKKFSPLNENSSNLILPYI